MCHMDSTTSLVLCWLGVKIGVKTGLLCRLIWNITVMHVADKQLVKTLNADAAPAKVAIMSGSRYSCWKGTCCKVKWQRWQMQAYWDHESSMQIFELCC